MSTQAAEALWTRAEALRPRDPWKAVSRAFNLNEASCVDAFRHRTVPPGVEDNAITRFLDRPAV
jgi:hypothetical protein